MGSKNETASWLGDSIRFMARTVTGLPIEPGNLPAAGEVELLLPPFKELGPIRFVGDAEALGDVIGAVGEPEEVYVEGAYRKVDGPVAEMVRLLRVANSTDTHTAQVIQAAHLLENMGFALSDTVALAVRAGLVSVLADDAKLVGTQVLFGDSISKLVQSTLGDTLDGIAKRSEELELSISEHKLENLPSFEVASAAAASASESVFSLHDEDVQRRYLAERDELVSQLSSVSVALANAEHHAAHRAAEVEAEIGAGRNLLARSIDDATSTIRRLERATTAVPWGAAKRKRQTAVMSDSLDGYTAELDELDNKISKENGPAQRALRTVQRQSRVLTAELAVVESRLSVFKARMEMADAAYRRVMAEHRPAIETEDTKVRVEFAGLREELRVEQIEAHRAAVHAVDALNAAMGSHTITL